MDIAPETEVVLNLQKKLPSFAISIAHTCANYNEAIKAIESGATMPPACLTPTGLSHREPGVIGAIFGSRVYGELVCDGHHVFAW